MAANRHHPIDLNAQDLGEHRGVGDDETAFRDLALRLARSSRMNVRIMVRPGGTVSVGQPRASGVATPPRRRGAW